MKKVKLTIKETKAKKDFLKDPLQGNVNIGTPEENYTFNLKKLVTYIPKKYGVEELDPNIFKKELKGIKEDPKTEKERISNANLEYPISVVKMPEDDGYIIIDGTHRIRKAIIDGVNIKTYIVPFKDLKKIKDDLRKNT